MDSHIIALTSVKGGAGKSTLATAIAAEWHRRARRVAIVDLDEIQRTACDWAQLAKDAGADAPPVVPMDDDVKHRLRRYSRDFEIVIVDCPGRVVERVTWVLGGCHVALMPCGPGSVDLLGMSATLRQMRKVLAAHPDVLARVLIAKKPPNTVLGRTARKAFDATGFDLMDTELDRYVDYDYAFAAGLGPTTYAPRSDMARQLHHLINELEKLLGMQPAPRRRKSSAA